MKPSDFTVPAATVETVPASSAERALQEDGSAATRTRVINAITDPVWPTAVQGMPGAGVFHQAAWMRVLHHSYGYRDCSILAEINGNPIGLLPLMEVDSWMTGRRGISLPFTDECAALTTEVSAKSQLFEAACAEGRRRRWRYLELRGPELPRPDATVATTFYGHAVDLTGGEKALLERINPSTRRSIRKAREVPLNIEISRSVEGAFDLFRLMRLTRRRHGVPPQPRSFFRHIQRNLLAEGQGFIVSAKNGLRTVAAALFLHTQRFGIFKFGASDDRYQHLRPNNLVMWEGIRALAELGCQALDLGRTSLSNDGLRRFKASWGSRERTVNYFRYDCMANRWLTAPDRSSGRHSSIFRRLPLPVSELIGALLYRHIA